MIVRPQTSFAMRPYLPDDAPVLADIFRSSIEGLTADDYTPAQQDAWMGSADEESFAERLGSALTLIATLEGTPVGFATLENNTTVDMLYVHPAVAGQGVGTMLVDALEKLAAARGTKRLTAEASDTAKPFFEKRGYVAQQRNTVTRGDEWLTNTTMSKDLGGGKAP
jgi:putative acetyltransferase